MTGTVMRMARQSVMANSSCVDSPTVHGMD